MPITRTGQIMGEISKHKPAILCLHGRGTSAEIFYVQTKRLRSMLEEAFDFVFVNGPFESPPGPGVVPVFEDRGPYYSWKNVDGFGGNATHHTITTIDKAIEEYHSATGRSFVGIMGFSQGGTLTAGVMLRQQAQNQKQSGHRVDGVRFGVCLMSSCPPLLIDNEDLQTLKEIIIPSLHVIGLRDKHKGMSREMALKYCDEKHATIMEVNTGHHLPTALDDTTKIAESIRKLYQETRI